MNYLAIFIGGGLGSLARYSIGLLFQRFDHHFPFGTFVANVLSCVLLGYIISWNLKDLIPTRFYLFLATGFCGGFSTFSTFSAESQVLLSEGHFDYAMLNLIGSLIVGLIAVWIGLKLGG